MVWSRYARGAVERSQYALGTVLVRSRYARGALRVRYVLLTFQRALLYTYDHEVLRLALDLGFWIAMCTCETTAGPQTWLYGNGC